VVFFFAFFAPLRATKRVARKGAKNAKKKPAHLLGKSRFLLAKAVAVP
jgi:hypothetical protein